MQHWKLTFLLLVFSAVAVQAADSLPSEVDAEGLRKLADLKRLPLGTAFAWREGFERAAYERQVQQHFNCLTPEDGLTIRVLQPARGVWDFSLGDAVVQFAQDHHMTARGQHLVWDHRFDKPETHLPDWLVNGNFNKSEIAAIMKEHIQTTMRHYKKAYPGVIRSWCVVNEAASGGDPATFQPSFWYDNLGATFVDDAFRWAREADPEAILYYNDWGAEGMGPKSDFVYHLVKGLQSRGIPIDGVGLQCHFSLKDYPGKEAIERNIARLAALHLEVYITELDVKIEGGVTDAKLQQQAGIVRDMLDLCLNNPACKSLTFWGFSDAQSWLSEAEAATLMTRDYRPKPAFLELKKGLSPSSTSR